MTRQQLELLWHGVESQMRWAAVHGGDQELLDLLRDQSDRLSVRIANIPSKPITKQHRPDRRRDQIARPTVAMKG
jgi:hypothetical protein